MKKRFTLLIIGLMLLSTLAYATGFPIVGSSSRSQQAQVFTPTSVISVSNGSLTVSSYKVMCFNDEVTIQLNGSGSTYIWPADTPIGIDTSVTSITISGLASATTAFVME